MFLMSPRFFALPLAAMLIIYALPRERTVSSSAVVASQNHVVVKVSSPVTRPRA